MTNHPTTPQIEIVLNGKNAAVPAGLSVGALLDHLQIKRDRVAVELDRQIVRQPDWDATRIVDGAAVEIVHFVGGG